MYSVSTQTPARHHEDLHVTQEETEAQGGSVIDKATAVKKGAKGETQLGLALKACTLHCLSLSKDQTLRARNYIRHRQLSLSLMIQRRNLKFIFLLNYLATIQPLQ